MNVTGIGATSGSCDGDPTRHTGHPLEAIPFFRRFRASPSRNLLYTLIWDTGIALIFSLFALLFEPHSGVLRVVWVNFVIANCIGFLIHGGFVLGNRLLGPILWRQSFGVRTLYYSAVSVAGVFGGYWLGFTLLAWREARASVFSPQGAITVLLLSLLISAIIASIFFARERQAKAEAAFERERARGEAAERHAKVAQLKMLEAQIEPHFLYNTLANVISLIDSHPHDAKRMVERLIEYLRRAAATAGAAEATLGRQIELLRAYLDIIVLRMGDRLSYRIEVPSELAALPLPPMLIQPVVENAIKHGLEPKVGGGMVRIQARRDDSMLVLEVEDNGLGFQSTRSASSTGLGLGNLRDRLASMYGGRARMEIEDREPGTRVTIALPDLVAS